MSSTEKKQSNEQGQDERKSHQMRNMYLRFGAMILTAMVVMYFVMFIGSCPNAPSWPTCGCASSPSRSARPSGGKLARWTG